MTSPAPTPTDTVICPGLHDVPATTGGSGGFYPAPCWLCGGRSLHHPIPTEIAAAWRLGGMAAVYAVALTDPATYGSLILRMAGGSTPHRFPG